MEHFLERLSELLLCDVVGVVSRFFALIEVIK